MKKNDNTKRIPKLSRDNAVSLIMYILGLVILPLGVALMEKSDFGVSMIVAPAYILFRYISKWIPGFTFGMAEYMLQGVLLVAMMGILRRFRVRYLFSFVTAVLYGCVLDFWMLPLRDVLDPGLGLRVIFFAAGMVISAWGVACFFHTRISPEVYELFVLELSVCKKIPMSKCKTVYDCVSCAVGIVLSFLFFGFGTFVGISYGTVFCALVNGMLIGFFSRIIDRILERSAESEKATE